jgi:leucyl aminopeptidase (aminopeptidase T)
MPDLAPAVQRILSGDVLEAEKILGPGHLALGASAGVGSPVSVPVPGDVVVIDGTLQSDGRPVLPAGQHLLWGCRRSRAP